MKNSIDCKAEEKVIEGTAFLIHVGTQQLSTYIEKKHYHVDKKVADTGSEWNPDTFFQPSDILVGISHSYRKYR